MSTRGNIALRNTETGETVHTYMHHDSYPLNTHGFLSRLFDIMTTPVTVTETYKNDEGWAKTRQVETGELTLKRFGDSAGAINHLLKHDDLNLELDAVSTDYRDWKALHGDIYYAYIVHLKNGQVDWIEAYKYEHTDSQLRTQDGLTLEWHGHLLSLRDYTDTRLDYVPLDERSTYRFPRVYPYTADGKHYLEVDHKRVDTDDGEPVEFETWEAANKVANLIQSIYDDLDCLIEQRSDGTTRAVPVRHG